MAEATRRLGVSRNTITRWAAKGRLTAQPPIQSASGRRPRHVSYPPASPAMAVLSGSAERHPEQAVRVMCEEPDAAWAAERFELERRREMAVRIERVEGGRNAPLQRRHYWLCPVCGCSVALLLLPAGRPARSGLTFAPWRFQCCRCTGVESEAEAWGSSHRDALGQWALKASCGRTSGREFRKALAQWMHDPKQWLGLSPATGP
jgi:hypothetical protein